MTRDAHLGGDVGDQAGLATRDEQAAAADWDGGPATIDLALELGITFLNTADAYGTGHNEVLVGRAINGRRDQVQLATKFGIDRSTGDRARRIRGARDYVLRACDASLLRLGVDVIDLYYAHRPPQDVEIEETVGAMAELVEAGKVRHLGPSEVDGELLRRAHAVHPITAVQSEYSLCTRDVEAVTPVLAELGVGLVPYSPLGRGFLTGTLDRSTLGEKDFRRTNPRFAGEAGEANEKIAQTVREVADRLGATPAQVALAWVYAQAERLGVAVAVAAVPGTRSPAELEQNAAALQLTLDADALAALDPLSDQVRGERYIPAHTAEVARD
ncbi:aldo/keto reductase [Amycolatopsis balhimycina]|uniref:aldo/keto reductase n=1 Tax=Amycolatopsis balhimycina TaxID=208443 RepID=UPI001FE06959|nr:aldo/keto reductase [Amycolatopsis balhimycina]